MEFDAYLANLKDGSKIFWHEIITDFKESTVDVKVHFDIIKKVLPNKKFIGERYDKDGTLISEEIKLDNIRGDISNLSNERIFKLFKEQAILDLYGSLETLK